MACWPRGTGPRKLAHYCGRHSLANFTIRGDDLDAAAGIRRTDRRAAAGHQGRAHECDGRAALQVIRDARSECETRIEWRIGDIGMQLLTSSLLELITQTSKNLPPDVRAAMSLTAGTETRHPQSSKAPKNILENIERGNGDEGPICQDTGMPTFVVHTPVGVNQMRIKKAIHGAIAEATRLGKLRPNSVDSLTGKNSGNNLGEETPVIHFEQWEQDQIEVKLILKGGGCENKNIQYSVPCN